jgi:hypothetical protein
MRRGRSRRGEIRGVDAEGAGCVFPYPGSDSFDLARLNEPRLDLIKQTSGQIFEDDVNGFLHIGYLLHALPRAKIMPVVPVDEFSNFHILISPWLFISFSCPPSCSGDIYQNFILSFFSFFMIFFYSPINL